MKRLKTEPSSLRRFKLLHILFGLAALYLIFLCFNFLDLLKIGTGFRVDYSSVDLHGLTVGDGDHEELSRPHLGSVFENKENPNAAVMPLEDALEVHKHVQSPIKPLRHHYGRITDEILSRKNRSASSMIERMADEAWTLGLKAWEELEKYDGKGTEQSILIKGNPETCPTWVSMSREELLKGDGVMFLPCGLAADSSITLVGTPHHAHHMYLSQPARLGTQNNLVLVSQFVVELLGLKSVVGEDPPKILHLNARLRGDWSHLPIIEHNTCYRMQWGTAQRCNGLASKNSDDMLVDGYLRCEKWMWNDIVDSRESKTTSWFQRFIGHAQKPEVTWPFPFVEGKMFVLTVHAGVDGFHLNVGGRHVTSFPYRTGFTLEDATGLEIRGDVDIHSVYATSLPPSHRSFSPKKVLDFSAKWRTLPLPSHPIQLFLGIISATNHFAERMAIRKTWMQYSAINSLTVVVRFFVALNPRNEVNAVLKEEAAYFGDIVILSFMDRYELVVLKTLAICEFGVENVTAAYIMKCDDDNFVRVDTVLKEIEGISSKRSPLYMGNLNLLHQPLRTGKWAVTYKEWPAEVYPPYANGPGYIISSDIARYVVSRHGNQSLRLFKMEDVSMGMWVQQFNSSKPVKYSHNWKFCQYGCMENYYSAHYQSPRQMVCLWENLAKGRATCCNF